MSHVIGRRGVICGLGSDSAWLGSHVTGFFLVPEKKGIKTLENRVLVKVKFLETIYDRYFYNRACGTFIWGPPRKTINSAITTPRQIYSVRPNTDY